MTDRSIEELLTEINSTLTAVGEVLLNFVEDDPFNLEYVFIPVRFDQTAHWRANGVSFNSSVIAWRIRRSDSSVTPIVEYGTVVGEWSVSP